MQESEILRIARMFIEVKDDCVVESVTNLKEGDRWRAAIPSSPQVLADDYRRTPSPYDVHVQFPIENITIHAHMYMRKTVYLGYGVKSNRLIYSPS